MKPVPIDEEHALGIEAIVAGIRKPCPLCSAPVPRVGNYKYCLSCLQRTCEQCGEVFNIRQARVAKFCSFKCYGQAKKGCIPFNKGVSNLPTKFCAYCKKAFVTYNKPAKFCSNLCRSTSQRGVNNANWRGGKSRESDTIEYKAWRLSILVRDGGRCRWCDSIDVRNYTKLEVHHIIPFSTCPDLLISNGITLCHEHHKKTKGRENEFAEFLSNLLGCALISKPMPNRKDKTPFVHTRDELYELYSVYGLSLKDIGDLKGVTNSCVLKYVKRYDFVQGEDISCQL